MSPLHVTRHLLPQHTGGSCRSWERHTKTAPFQDESWWNKSCELTAKNEAKKKEKKGKLLVSWRLLLSQSSKAGGFLCYLSSLYPQAVSLLPEISTWVFLTLGMQFTSPAKLEDPTPQDENCPSHSCPYLWEGKTWVSLHHWKVFCCLYVENSHIRNIKK